MKKIAVIFLIIFAIAACSKKDADKSAYLAKVGNTKITLEDFDREFQALPQYAQQMFQDPSGKEKVLDDLISKELLYQEAVKRGLDNSPDFKKKLDDFRKSVLAQEVLEKEILSKGKVSDQEVKDYYDKHKEEFTTVSQLRASHILVKTPDEAEKVMARLKKGEKFEDVARAVSIDKNTAKQGGDLGYFSRGQMAPEFEKAAASLKVGEISNPVKTQFGYHIIKVTARKAGPVVEFERVKDLISQKLSGERQREAFEKYIAELKKTYKVEINKDALMKSAQEGKEKPQAAPEQPAQQKGEPKKEAPAKETPKQEKK